MENNLSLAMRLYYYTAVHPQIKEAIECYQLTAYWAMRLDIDMDAVREGARSLSEFEGIPFRAAIEKYGRSVERMRMKNQLDGLPLIGPIFKKITLPTMTHGQKKEIRKSSRRKKHEVQ